MKLRKIYTSAGILLLSLFCIGDAVAKDAKFETGVSFGSTGADEPYSSLTDKDGNYYISGMCRGDVEFADGATIKGRGGMDAVIVKYDAELNFLWARAVGGSKDDTFERIAVTSAGDIVAVGKISGDVTIDGTDQTLSGTQSTDGCIVVYDKDGNYKSSAQIKAAGASLCYSVAVDKSDNIFVTGSTVGATDFGNEKTVTIEGSNSGTFLACYNNSLVCQWAIAGSSPVQSYGWAVNFDKEENILLTGRFGTTFTITGTDGASLTLPFVRDYDIYTVLYSYTLMVKTKTLEPGVANEPYYSNIVVDNVEGAVKFEIVSGALPDGITLSKDGAFAGTPTKNGSYTFTVKISDDVSSIQKEYTLVIKSGEGCDVFIVTDQCPDAYIGYPYSLQLEIEGEGITCALTGGSLPVGLSLSPEGLISGTPAESNEPGICSFTVKATGASGCDDELELSMILSDETPSGINRVSLDSFQVYPTVSYGEITLKADFGKDMKARVAVVTPLGTCVWEKTYYVVQLDEVISTADMQPGVYYLVLSTEEGKSTKPFIVKR